MFDIPILIITFNRPDKLSQLLKVLTTIKPKKLYVAIDGPRGNSTDDKQKITKSIEILENGINWRCERKLLKRSTNLGCGVSPSSSISWFFEQEEEGIILEDDCYPTESFFFFCKDLLNKYRYDSRVMHISGYNRFPSKNNLESYYYSYSPGVWGWATWKRAWKYFDLNLDNYKLLKKNNNIKNIYSNKIEKLYRVRFLEKIIRGRFNSCWDYQWEFAIRANHGVCIRPNQNLVNNTGFDENATHTKGKKGLVGQIAKEIKFPLKDPSYMVPNHRKDFVYLIKTIVASKIS